MLLCSLSISKPKINTRNLKRQNTKPHQMWSLSPVTPGWGALERGSPLPAAVTANLRQCFKKLNHLKFGSSSFNETTDDFFYSCRILDAHWAFLKFGHLKVNRNEHLYLTFPNSVTTKKLLLKSIKMLRHCFKKESHHIKLPFIYTENLQPN